MYKKTCITSSIMFVIGVVFIIGILNYGCTDNIRAKKFGGTMTETLPTNTKHYLKLIILYINCY